MSDVPDWLKELSTDKQAQLKDWLDAELQTTSRRDLLKAMGAVGAGGAMGAAGMGAMSQPGRAADTGVGNLGEVDNPVDVHLDQILDGNGNTRGDLDVDGTVDWQGTDFDNLRSVATDDITITNDGDGSGIDADDVDGYDVEKNGTDGSGIINFKT